MLPSRDHHRRFAVMPRSGRRSVPRGQISLRHSMSKSAFAVSFPFLCLPRSSSRTLITLSTDLAAISMAPSGCFPIPDRRRDNEASNSERAPLSRQSDTTDTAGYTIRVRISGSSTHSARPYSLIRQTMPRRVNNLFTSSIMAYDDESHTLSMTSSMTTRNMAAGIAWRIVKDASSLRCSRRP